MCIIVCVCDPDVKTSGFFVGGWTKFMVYKNREFYMLRW